MALSHHVEVDQVDCCPRSEEIEQYREKLPKAVDKVLRHDQRQDQRAGKTDGERGDPLAEGRFDALDRIDDRQQGQGGAVEIERRDGHEPGQRREEQHGAEARIDNVARRADGL